MLPFISGSKYGLNHNELPRVAQSVKNRPIGEKLPYLVTLVTDASAPMLRNFLLQ